LGNTNSYKNSKREPRVGKTLFDDIRRGDFKKTIKRDYREMKEYFIDEAKKEQLKKMKKIKRFFYTSVWLLKSMFFKLTPARRILLVISVLLLFSYTNTGTNNIDIKIMQNGTFAYIVLLFILMLELKDKLLAHGELEEGHAVQVSLMPEQKTSLPGWSIWLYTQPANEVGGDMVDYIKIDENRYGVALCDVVGKGLGAALLMAKLQSTLRALVSDFHSLAELGNKINQIFYRDSLPNIFASLIYSELQPNNGVITLLNAGHLPPILLKSDSIFKMPKGSPALGLSGDILFFEQKIELQKNDYLIIYSDGITEARNESGDFFGDFKFESLLPDLRGLTPEQAGENILSVIDNFVKDARYYDDLSLIILKRIN